MNEQYKHSFRRMDTKESELVEAPMFDGLAYGVAMAKQTGCDVTHLVYDDNSHWCSYIVTHHPDGTSTNLFGEHRRFTGNRNDWWEDIEV